MTKKHVAIGLMSGTSADGVDAALVETDGEHIMSTGPYEFVEYTQSERTQILEKMQEVIAAPDHQARQRLGAQIAPMITQRHKVAVERLIAKANLKTADIDVIGFHGQTLYHEPESQFTLQAGDAPSLAQALSLPVVYDFRSNDMAQGGQGAPLVPVYHRALAAHSHLTLPVCVVNIGGVANVTYIDKEGELLAFDTGPGNVLIDEWIGKKTGERMDVDGAYASAGTFCPPAVEAFISHVYFKARPPKSLDRYDFSDELVEDFSLEDGAATLVEFTVRAIQHSLNYMPSAPKSMIIVGGGAKNPYMMHRLAERLKIPVKTGDELGWQSGYVEAEAFGFLAVRHLEGLPLTYPGTTGVEIPQNGGLLAPVI